MEESTPIFDALWEKYNATPIFDQVLREHENKKYLELVEPYKYHLNDKRVFTLEGFHEFLTSIAIPAYYGEPQTVPTMSYEEWQESFLSPPEQGEQLMTSKWQDLVNEFRKAMDLPVSDGPRQLTGEEAELHIQMIRDEFEKEFVPFARSNNLVAFYDAGIDLIVYILGSMSNAGMDVDPGFVEIMRSKMSKMDPVTKKPIRSRGVEHDGEPAGKILKGPHYSPPKLGKILNDQTTYGHEDTAVYKNLTLPLTLGIGGPKIGEGTLHMDHNGELMFKGMMADVAILPILDHLGLSVSGVSMGPDEGSGDPEELEYNEVKTFDDRTLTTNVTTFDPPLLFEEKDRHNNDVALPYDR